MHSLCLLLLRQPSKNAFHDAEKLSLHLKQNLLKLIHAPSTPSPKVTEDIMLKLDENELESILPNLFHQLLRGKLFLNYIEFILPMQKAMKFNFFSVLMLKLLIFIMIGISIRQPLVLFA